MNTDFSTIIVVDEEKMNNHNDLNFIVDKFTDFVIPKFNDNVDRFEKMILIGINVICNKCFEGTAFQYMFQPFEISKIIYKKYNHNLLEDTCTFAYHITADFEMIERQPIQYDKDKNIRCELPQYTFNDWEEYVIDIMSLLKKCYNFFDIDLLEFNMNKCRITEYVDAESFDDIMKRIKETYPKCRANELIKGKGDII